MAQFSLLAWRSGVEIETADAISAEAIKALGAAQWETGRAALARAIGEAADLRAQFEHAAQTAKAAKLATAAAEQAAKPAFGPGVILLDGDAPDRTTLDFKRSERMDELSRDAALPLGIALSRLTPEARDAAFAVFRAATQALSGSDAQERLTGAIFAPLSPTLALLPVLGMAAVAEPATPGGMVALRAGLATGVLSSQTDEPARLAREADALFGFSPGNGDQAGSFDQNWRAFSRDANFQSAQEVEALKKITKKSLAAALGCSDIDLSSLFHLTGAVPASSISPGLSRKLFSGQAKERTDLPQAFGDQAMALIQNEKILSLRASKSTRDSSWKHNLSVFIMGTNQEPSPRPMGLPIFWAIAAADFLAAANDRELPSLLAHPSLRANLSDSLNLFLDQEAHRKDEPQRPKKSRRSETERERNQLRNQRGAARSQLAVFLANHKSLVEEAFAASRCLNAHGRDLNLNFEKAIATAALTAFNRVPDAQAAWGRQAGAKPAQELARRAFGLGSLSVSQLARVARSPAAFSQALDECGAPGRLAAGLSEALGLSPLELESGNALCALARDAWISHGGSAAGWRLLGQMPTPMVDALLLRVSQQLASQTTNAPSFDDTDLKSTLRLAELCAVAHMPAERLAMALALSNFWPEGDSAPFLDNAAAPLATHHDDVQAALASAGIAPSTTQGDEDDGDYRIDQLLMQDFEDLDLGGPGALRNRHGGWNALIATAGSSTLPEWARLPNQHACMPLLAIFSDPLSLLAGVRPADDAQAAALAEEKQAASLRMPFLLRDFLDRVAKTDAMRPSPPAASVIHLDFDALAAHAAQYPADPAPEQRRAIDARARFVGEMQDVLDFFRNIEPGVWQTFPEKPQWPAIVRRAKEWHDLVLTQENAERMKTQWAPLLGEQADGEFTARELTNGAELHAEGQRMHHCVSTYAQRCVDGARRIFSIEKNNAPHSTLELVWEGNVWRAGQNLGYCNTRAIDAKAIDLGGKIATKANALHLRPQTVEEAARQQASLTPAQEFLNGGPKDAVSLLADDALHVRLDGLLARREARVNAVEPQPPLPGGAALGG